MVVDNVVLAFFKPVPVNPNTFTQTCVWKAKYGNERGCQVASLNIKAWQILRLIWVDTCSINRTDNRKPVDGHSIMDKCTTRGMFYQ